MGEMPPSGGLTGRRLAVLLVLAAGCAVASADSNGYDYFLFVRQWGVSFCREAKCAIKPVERFSIHGLWPERADGSWPACCDAHYPFSMAKLAPLIPELVYEWFSYTYGIHDQCRWDATHWMAAPGTTAADTTATTPARRMLSEAAVRAQLLQQPAIDTTAAARVQSLAALVASAAGGAAHAVGDAVHAVLESAQQVLGVGDGGGSPNYQFWRHEWEKHGTCCLDVFEDEYHYFLTVLKLQDDNNLDTILSDAGIVPSAKPYRTSDIVRAIRKGTGYMPNISCRDDDIMEVRLCVDKQLRLMDCPSRTTDGVYGCASELYIPPAPGRHHQ